MQAESSAKPIQFGNYQVVRKIASGGMAEVYEAYRVGLENFQTRVALKCVRPEMTADERFLKMFINEAHLGSQLHHPNIVQIQDFNRVGEIYYLAMEYVEGIDLSRFMRRAQQIGEPLPRPVMLDIIFQALAGLGYAHAAKGPDGKPMHIVHRDIKPSNFLLNRQGTVKIADFGIAKAATSTYQTQTQDHIKGTLRYMSPEQVDGAKLSPGSDLFSLSVIMYELITFRELFDAPSIPATLIKIATANVAGDLAHVESAWPEMAVLMRKALHRDPDQRFLSSEELTRVLRTFKDRFASEGALERFLRAHPEMFEETLPTMPSPETLNGPMGNAGGLLASVGFVADSGGNKRGRSREDEARQRGTQQGSATTEADTDGFHKTEIPDLPDSEFPGEPDDAEVDPSRAKGFVYRPVTAEQPRGRPIGSLWDTGSAGFQGAGPTPSGGGIPGNSSNLPPELTSTTPTAVALPPPGVTPHEETTPTVGRNQHMGGADPILSSTTVPLATWTPAAGDERPQAPPAKRRTVNASTVISLLLAMGLVGVLAWLQPWKTISPAMLNVSSNPANARILLDGQDTGVRTPATVRLPAEKPESVVRLEGDNHLFAQRSWSYQPGQLLTWEATLQLAPETPGALTVSSEPTGARILMDGVDTGKVTPSHLEGLQPGVHRLEVRVDGREPKSMDVEVASGGDEGVHLDIPAPAPVVPEPQKKEQDPRGQKGQGTKQTHTKQDKGPHSGGTKQPVVPDDPPPRQPPPTRADGQGTLTVNTVPPDATVFIDGKAMGSVPQRNLALPTGRHAVVVKLGSGEEMSRTVEIKKDELLTVVGNFQTGLWKVQ